MVDRLPPYSREAERAVLGGMLRDERSIPEVVQLLVSAERFYFDAHQWLFRGIADLRDRNEPVDLVSLAEWLRARQQIENVGGYAYLGELWDANPTGANTAYYAKVVREKSVYRCLIRVATDLLKEAYEPTLPADELLAVAEQKVLALAEDGLGGDVVAAQQAVAETFDRLDARSRPERGESALLTNFVDLDEKTGGLHPSELVIVGARPSVGKTAFACALVRSLTLQRRVPAFFVSLEQTRVELSERVICAEQGISSHALRKNQLSPADVQRFYEGGEQLARAPLFIDDYFHQPMLRIAANARRLKQQRGLRLVVVDYLQLVQPENRRDSRHEQVSQVVRRLKWLARELRLPVVALAQVNRGAENRPDQRPRLSDLRESGGIEQEADVVLLLHEPEDEPKVVEVDIAKQRNGPKGVVPLAFHKEWMRFENYMVEVPE